MFRSPARSRRRIGTVAKIGVGVVIAAIVGLSLYFSTLSTERIRDYSVDAVVLQDGSALVRETIDYDFGSNWRHGILREIPEPSNSGDGVSDVAVRSATAPADTQLSDTYNGVQIRIGDPETTVTGRHRYVIEYRLSGVTVDGKLALNVIGDQWKVPIDRAEIAVTAPYALDDVTCNQGASYSTTRCEGLAVSGDKLTVASGGLGESEGVTVYARTGDQSADPVTALPKAKDLRAGSDPYWWVRTLALILGLGTIGYVVGLVPVTRWARRVGRDLAWHGEGGPVDAVFGGPGLEVGPVDDVVADEQTTIQFVPPRDLTPAQGGVLLRETVNDQHRVAWLTERSMEGWFAIEDSGKDLRWTAADDRWAAAPAPLQQVFTGRHQVSLGAYDKQFAKGWRLIDGELNRWKLTCGLWDQATERRSRKVSARLSGLGILAGVLGGLALAFTAQSLPWLAAAVGLVAAVPVGGGVAAALGRSELAVRTPAGFAKRQLVEGFRRFFEVSEGRHAREAADRGELRLYSAWAVALGELGHWQSAMTAAALPPSTPGVMDTHHIALMSVAAHTASTPPSSSGSGGGGSSGVGGGAGGGGGGSW